MTTTARPPGLTRTELAQRVAADLVDGWCVNVGIGVPLQLPTHVPPDRQVLFHCEHGLVGIGPQVSGADADADVTDAGKNYVSLVDGAAAFDSALSFAIARGGRLDLAVLGALQVSQGGDLANWVVPGGDPGVGGAMDLAVGARRVWVLMSHVDKKGNPKLLSRCTFPLTGRAVVHRVYTDLAVFDFVDGQLTLRECVAGVGPDRLASLTDAAYVVDLW